MRVDEGLVTRTKIDLEVSGEKLKLLLEECALVLGKRVNGRRVHHHATTRTTSVAAGCRGRQADPGNACVLVCLLVQESLAVGF